jgi:PAS domain S-box-containing protein
VGPILNGGAIATLLYGTTNFTVSDLLVSRRCQRLRLAAIRQQLDPYRGPTLQTWVRVATLTAPTVLALVVVQRLATNARGSWAAQVAIVILGSGLCAALGWLHAFANRNAAADLSQAASRLTSGEPARLVTGSTDALLVDMARVFNAAADRVDRSLTISAARYSALFEGAGDAILLVDASTGAILEANRSAEQLTARSLQSLRTLRFDALFDGEAEAVEGSENGHSAASALRRGPQRVMRPDGGKRPVDVALSTVAVGDWKVVQAILHDVGVLTAQNAELREAQERLTEADRLKSEFMGMMSHELRTPLNVFVGYTEMLLDAARDAPRSAIGGHHHVLERLVDSAQNLTTLVEDTLSVLRLEGGGMRVHRERFSLEALFDDLRDAAPFHTPSDVAEHWRIEDGLPMLETDRLKLRQIVTNLVGNARKFTTAGSITVHAFRGGGDRISIRVEDTGCGIADSELPFVFDLYRQAATGMAHNGCGIGLYIVRRYCEMLGGRVEADSEIGRGTRITVTLPCEEEESCGGAEVRKFGRAAGLS